MVSIPLVASITFGGLFALAAILLSVRHIYKVCSLRLRARCVRVCVACGTDVVAAFEKLQPS